MASLSVLFVALCTGATNNRCASVGVSTVSEHAQHLVTVKIK